MYDFQPEEPERFEDHVQLNLLNKNDVLHLVFKVLNSDIDNASWKVAKRNVVLFLEWSERSNIQYHFIFDVHECDTIPARRLYSLQKLLRKHQKYVKKYLHSSVVITRNKLVQSALEIALNLIHPNRPLKILLANPNEGQRGENNIPLSTWEHCNSFFEINKLST